MGRTGSPFAVDVLRERFLGPEIFFQPQLYAGGHSGAHGLGCGWWMPGLAAGLGEVGAWVVPMPDRAVQRRHPPALRQVPHLPPPAPEMHPTVHAGARAGRQPLYDSLLLRAAEGPSALSILPPDWRTPLPEVIDRCVQSCPIDCRRGLYSNITLSGGTTMLKHFGARIQASERAVPVSSVQCPFVHASSQYCRWGRQLPCILPHAVPVSRTIGACLVLALDPAP